MSCKSIRIDKRFIEENDNIEWLQSLFDKSFDGVQRPDVRDLVRKEDEYEFWALYDEDLGYVGATNWVKVMPHVTFGLWIATVPEVRGKGYGRELVKLTRDVMKANKQVFIALIEDPDDEDCDNREYRQKREEFYVENGYYISDFKYDLYGVSMKLISLNGTVEKDVADQAYEKAKKYINHESDLNESFGNRLKRDAIEKDKETEIAKTTRRTFKLQEFCRHIEETLVSSGFKKLETSTSDAIRKHIPKSFAMSKEDATEEDFGGVFFTILVNMSFMIRIDVWSKYRFADHRDNIMSRWATITFASPDSSGSSSMHLMYKSKEAKAKLERIFDGCEEGGYAHNPESQHQFVLDSVLLNAFSRIIEASSKNSNDVSYSEMQLPFNLTRIQLRTKVGNDEMHKCLDNALRLSEGFGARVKGHDLTSSTMNDLAHMSQGFAHAVKQAGIKAGWKYEGYEEDSVSKRTMNPGSFKLISWKDCDFYSLDFCIGAYEENFIDDYVNSDPRAYLSVEINPDLDSKARSFMIGLKYFVPNGGWPRTTQRLGSEFDEDLKSLPGATRTEWPETLGYKHGVRYELDLDYDLIPAITNILSYFRETFIGTDEMNAQDGLRCRGARAFWNEHFDRIAKRLVSTTNEGFGAKVAKQAANADVSDTVAEMTSYDWPCSVGHHVKVKRSNDSFKNAWMNLMITRSKRYGEKVMVTGYTPGEILNVDDYMCKYEDEKGNTVYQAAITYKDVEDESSLIMHNYMQSTPKNGRMHYYELYPYKDNVGFCKITDTLIEIPGKGEKIGPSAGFKCIISATMKGSGYIQRFIFANYNGKGPKTITCDKTNLRITLKYENPNMTESITESFSQNVKEKAIENRETEKAKAIKKMSFSPDSIMEWSCSNFLSDDGKHSKWSSVLQWLCNGKVSNYRRIPTADLDEYDGHDINVYEPVLSYDITYVGHEKDPYYTDSTSQRSLSLILTYYNDNSLTHQHRMVLSTLPLDDNMVGEWHAATFGNLKTRTKIHKALCKLLYDACMKEKWLKNRVIKHLK